ncbi:unnamed protein product [Cylicostephanus goldi]|uniref:Uncharacterized protein n=1 Tax=Cylicostephanus goldi TaxID=71465 RepID=A0A3P7MJF4_CYLGO|nr:unnamed protein product [Cylicostephanus goldi]
MNQSQTLVVDIVPNSPNTEPNELVIVSCATNEKEVIHERLSPNHLNSMDIQISLASEGFLNVDIMERNVLLVAARYAVPTLCQIVSENNNDIKIIQLTDESGCTSTSAITPFLRKLAERGTIYTAKLNSSVFSGLNEPQLQCSVVACGDLCIQVGNSKKFSQCFEFFPRF